MDNPYETIKNVETYGKINNLNQTNTKKNNTNINPISPTYAPFNKKTILFIILIVIVIIIFFLMIYLIFWHSDSSGDDVIAKQVQKIVPPEIHSSSFGNLNDNSTDIIKNTGLFD